MTRIFKLATGDGFWLMFLVAAAVLGPWMWPVQWSGNEINYFDLGYRTVHPEKFTDHHAVFDNTNGRIVGLSVIGLFVSAFGFEAAKSILALGLWLVSSLGLAAIARQVGLRAFEFALALYLFASMQSGILGREWIFGTVETKGLAYAAVFFAAALAMQGRMVLPMLLAALATYMHFLVGGFWGLALVVLHAIRFRNAMSVLAMAAGFLLLVAPLVVLLARERLGVTVDTSGLDRSLNAIYVELSAHFHTGPLLDGYRHFLQHWFPGACAHIAFIFALWMMRSQVPDRGLLTWLIALNAYVLMALLAYMADAGTYRFAHLYLLRPAGFTALLSGLVLARAVFAGLAPDSQPRTGATVLVAVVLMTLPPALYNLGLIATKYPPGNRLYATLSPAERDVVAWIAEETDAQDAILVEPVGTGTILEGDAFPGGLERLTGRGLVVNFKYIPTEKRDILRWYRLIQARQAFFRGDCSQNDLLGGDFAIMRKATGSDAVLSCMTVLRENEGFAFGRIVN